MEKQFATYEIALALKELDFDEPCLARFDKYGNRIQLNIDDRYASSQNSIKDGKICDCLAPLWQQVIDWFREKYGIIVNWNLHDGDNPETWRITISHYDGYYLLYNQNVGKEPYYKTYEEARKQAILKAIELCQKEK